MCLYFRVMITSVTSEELIGILEEKLEQKLALFKSTFDETGFALSSNSFCFYIPPIILYLLYFNVLVY